jgi:uncharacterized protein YcgL (UPF0745 family)
MIFSLLIIKDHNTLFDIKIQIKLNSACQAYMRAKKSHVYLSVVDKELYSQREIQLAKDLYNFSLLMVWECLGKKVSESV